MEIKQLINDYLKKSLLLQIATSDNGLPWICTVCFAYDSQFNLYWFSRHNTRHSQEIVRNPIVAGAVVQPYRPGDKSRGLQFSGSATELQKKKDVLLGLAALKKRYGVKDKRINQLRKEILLHIADYGLYRLRPDTIILHDTVNFPDSPRRVYVPGLDMVQSHLQARQ